MTDTGTRDYHIVGKQQVPGAGLITQVFAYLMKWNCNFAKDLFDRVHNPSHSTLYPDVLTIKTIIVEKQNLAKMSFVYYLQI